MFGVLSESLTQDIEVLAERAPVTTLPSFLSLYLRAPVAEVTCDGKQTIDQRVSREDAHILIGKYAQADRHLVRRSLRPETSSLLLGLERVSAPPMIPPEATNHFSYIAYHLSLCHQGRGRAPAPNRLPAPATPDHYLATARPSPPSQTTPPHLPPPRRPSPPPRQARPCPRRPHTCTLPPVSL